MTLLIELKNVKKYFRVGSGMLHAVDDISISIPKAATLGLVGESGCGKSTLGRLCIRLLEADEGEIYFDGVNLRNLSKKEMQLRRTDMQIIFQDPLACLNARRNVYELISEPLTLNPYYWQKISKRDITKKVTDLMDTVGLSKRFINSYPHELDGGRRQRVGIARALSVDPKFIVCDEPVSALDVSIQAQILNLLMDLQEERGLTYLFITHNLSVVKHISSEIAVMYLGQCVEKAPADELFKNPLHPYTKALLKSIAVPKLEYREMVSTIHGELSDPINTSPGCRFAPRCDSCFAKCTIEDCQLIDMGGGHLVACYLY
jgi:oligopeptide/dipeptide ABC transporter ATP-binding protein